MKAEKLTPKKVALAIGVSESSMKRWCDRGLIDFQTTAGGHRRLSRPSVVDFVRTSKHSLIRSEMIGLPSGIRPNERDPNSARQDFLASIIDGNEDLASQIILELFLSGRTVAEIGDDVIGPAFQEIGIQWELGSLEVYRERRACEITLKILAEIRQLLPTPDVNAPLAMGGAPEKDSYSLPTCLVEMVFREAGWRAQSLGSQLPFNTLAAAAIENRPRLFWLSVSSITNEEEFLESFERFRSALPPETFLTVGGRALHGGARQKMQYSAFGDNLRQLDSLANTLRSPSFPIPTSRPGTSHITNY